MGMGAVSALVMAGLLLGGTAAWAEAPEVHAQARDREQLAPFGLMLDAGIPNGAGLSLAFRPTRAVRLDAGATYNGVRGGARAGITLLPLPGDYTPSLTFELGHAEAASSKALARRMADLSQLPLFSMERVGYTYASTHLGFEVGASQRYAFFLRAGLSWVELDVPDVRDLAEPFIDSLGKTGAQGGRFVYMMPSAKLGLILYFG